MGKGKVVSFGSGAVWSYARVRGSVLGPLL